MLGLARGGSVKLSCRMGLKVTMTEPQMITLVKIMYKFMNITNDRRHEANNRKTTFLTIKVVVVVLFVR